MTAPEDSQETRYPTNDDDRHRYAVRTVIAVFASLVVVAFIVGAAFIKYDDDGCGRWQDQFDALSDTLTRYVRTKGANRRAALLELEQLSLPCEKVARARDLCIGAYRHLYLAEEQHIAAQKLVVKIEGTIHGIDEPNRTIAELRFLQNKSAQDIANKVGMPEAEVIRRIDEAMEAMGAKQMKSLHNDFEGALSRSKRHVEAARTGNVLCDEAYKILLEEEQEQ